MKLLVAVLFCVVVASAAPPALDLFDDVEANDQQSPAEQFECIAKFLGELSMKNGMEESWKRTEPVLKRHIEDWKGCSTKANKFMKIICHLKNGFQTFRSLSEYLQIVAQTNPKMLMEFVKGLPTRCNGQTPENLFELFDL